MEDREFCRESSAACGESLVATAATDVSVWLLLEVREPWAAKAVEALSLPPEVKTLLSRWLAEHPQCRPQLLRQPRRDSGPLTAYIVHTGGEQPTTLRFELEDLAELPVLAFPETVAALERGEVPPHATRSEVPLVLVCTHAKRDACCAKWGQPVYQRAAAETGVEVWQTSHLGGHRFAATLAVLPSGLCYGRVEPHEVPELVASVREDRVWRLDRLRGRCSFGRAAMAAEHYLRAHTGQLEGRCEVLDVDETVNEEPRVTLRLHGITYRLALSLRPLEHHVIPSCGKPPEPVANVELRALTRD